MEAIPNFDIYIFVAVILFILGLFSTVLYSRMEPRERDKYSSYGGGSVEDFVKLADDEEIIRDYNVATVEKPSYGEVHFAITNKRLIMYVWAERTVQVNSAEIKDVRGTDIYWSKRQRRHLGIGLVVAGVLLSTSIILPWLYQFTAEQSGLPNPVPLVSLIAPFFMFVIGIYYIKKIRNILVILINIKAATGAFTFHSYSKSIFDQEWNPEKLELDAMPGPDAKKMARELGGLILTIQQE